jgi:hypothetical protein
MCDVRIIIVVVEEEEMTDCSNKRIDYAFVTSTPSDPFRFIFYIIIVYIVYIIYNASSTCSVWWSMMYDDRRCFHRQRTSARIKIQWMKTLEDDDDDDERPAVEEK